MMIMRVVDPNGYNSTDFYVELPDGRMVHWNNRRRSPWETSRIVIFPEDMVAVQ